MLDQITDWITRIVETLGYVGVTARLAFEVAVPIFPIPSEVILPLIGFEANRGEFNVLLMILAASIGSVIGSLALYYLANWFGEVRLRALVERHGKWLRVSTRDLDRADSWFDRYGVWVVMFGRCVPLVRSLISLPAGIRRMPIVQFVAFTFMGSACWNTALIGGGWLLGDNFHRIEQYVTYLQIAVVITILVLGSWFVWRRFGPGRASSQTLASSE